MPNIFGIIDDILVLGYNEDGVGHDATVHKVLRWCREVSLKLNKDKSYFRCTSTLFFSVVISWEGVQPDPQKFKVLTDMPAPNNEKELQAFLGIICYPRYHSNM